FCYAQTINISGVVKDKSGNELQGANVRLGITDLKTTTGADGSFTLSSSTSAVKYPLKKKSNAETPFLVLNNGRFSFSTSEISNFTLRIYNITGQLLRSQTSILMPGAHSIPLPNRAHGIYLCQITLNGRSFVFKNISTVFSRENLPTAITSEYSIKKASEAEPFEDALLVSMDGYYLSRLVITNPDTTDIQISMTPLITGSVTDIEGNVYRTVTFGSQEWTIDNFRSSRLNDNTIIPLVTDSAAWVTTNSPAYCFYDNSTDSVKNKKFGALYNWYTINTGKLAPSGWHVPSDAEWDTLQNYLISNGYNYDGSTTENLIAIAMASKTDWDTFTVVGAPGQNQEMNNSSGFSALPGGHRNSEGSFDGMGRNAHFWCTTESEFDSTLAYDHEIYHYFWYLGKLPFSKKLGSSVRLVKDK
ncbi:MAG: T9SS type A sorting domain-containing protein, partial [Fibrobacter sp.]|nr:T9SS type A sorting domain-containing protein [Fibrobacter sp.]